MLYGATATGGYIESPLQPKEPCVFWGCHVFRECGSFKCEPGPRACSCSYSTLSQIPFPIEFVFDVDSLLISFKLSVSRSTSFSTSLRTRCRCRVRFHSEFVFVCVFDFVPHRVRLSFVFAFDFMLCSFSSDLQKQKNAFGRVAEPAKRPRASCRSQTVRMGSKRKVRKGSKRRVQKGSKGFERKGVEVGKWVIVGDAGGMVGDGDRGWWRLRYTLREPDPIATKIEIQTSRLHMDTTQHVLPTQSAKNRAQVGPIRASKQSQDGIYPIQLKCRPHEAG